MVSWIDFHDAQAEGGGFKTGLRVDELLVAHALAADFHGRSLLEVVRADDNSLACLIGGLAVD